MNGENADQFWSRYKDLVPKDFSVIQKIGIPNSTLSTWKKKGIFPRADVACQIAHSINTTVEYLVTGNSSTSFVCSSNDRETIMILDRLSNEGKDIIKSIMLSLINKYPHD
jgi:transcriptional regulator with XRE-family HTH domain